MPGDVDTPIYLDHHATTPVADEVMAEMEPYFTERYGNPASDDHRAGGEANAAVTEARERIASVIAADRPRDIIFTSGATESDNLALKGPVKHALSNGEPAHIVTAVTEHDAVLESCAALEEEYDAVEVTYLEVDDYGRVDPEAVRAAIRDETILISIMAANNEIGTIAPLEEIGAIADEEDVYFHTDAVQAMGYCDLDVQRLGIDLMSISAHKIYGPKGIGALYVRRRNPKVQLEPLLHGGGHERGLRSGTPNVPAIVGLGKAVQLAEETRETRTQRLEDLRDQLWAELDDRLDEIVLNGHPEHRLPNNLNISFKGVDNYSLIRRLNPEIMVAAGSACATAEGEVEPSHVLTALTDDEERLSSAIRIGLGKDITRDQIQYAADKIVDNVSRDRQLQFT